MHLKCRAITPILIKMKTPLIMNLTKVLDLS